MMALLLCLRALVLSLQLCCSINVRLYCFRPLLCTWLTNAPFFPHTFSFRYGKVSQCFNMKNHVYMPDDFGFGHMKHCVAINTTSWLDQSLEIIESRYIGAFRIISKLLISKLDILKLSAIWRNCRYRNCQENDQTIIVIEKMTYRWPLAEGRRGWEASESDKQVLLLWLRLPTSEQENKTHLLGVRQLHRTLSPEAWKPKTFWIVFTRKKENIGHILLSIFGKM